jgi:ABC-type glycerol-3-phosphate transport system substrate-binding protein
MKNITLVQAIILGVAGVAILFAVFLFAFYRGGGSGVELSEVVMWGTIPQEHFITVINKKRQGDERDFLSNLIYIEKDPETFDQEFLSAIAEGVGPDMVILRENQIFENENRLIKVPYESFDLRSFSETYIEEAEILTTESGLIGLPFMVNPLVMYYNRDIFNAEGVARVPETWTEVLSISPSLSVSDSVFNISRSAISLGDYSNIDFAKEIVWTLIMQAGNDVIIRDSSAVSDEGSSPYFSILDEKLNYSLPPAYAALNFYTQFANASRTTYSWNRSLAQSSRLFLSGDLAIYLGFASEFSDLRKKNPNLNFDVAVIPQSKKAADGGNSVTYGQMHFIAIPKNSRNPQSAFLTAGILSGKEFQTELAKVTDLPPIRRDLLTNVDPESSFDAVFKRSALISRGILEPGDGFGDQLIKRMVESILSGENEVEDAIRDADLRLNQALRAN